MRVENVSNNSRLTAPFFFLLICWTAQQGLSYPHPQAPVTFSHWLQQSRKSQFKIDGFISCSESLCYCCCVMNHQCYIAPLPPKRTRRTLLTVSRHWNCSCWLDTGAVAMRKEDEVLQAGGENAFWVREPSSFGSDRDSQGSLKCSLSACLFYLSLRHEFNSYCNHNNNSNEQ